MRGQARVDTGGAQDPGVRGDVEHDDRDIPGAGYLAGRVQRRRRREVAGRDGGHARHAGHPSGRVGREPGRAQPQVAADEAGRRHVARGGDAGPYGTGEAAHAHREHEDGQWQRRTGRGAPGQGQPQERDAAAGARGDRPGPVDEPPQCPYRPRVGAQREQAHGGTGQHGYRREVRVHAGRREAAPPDEDDAGHGEDRDGHLDRAPQRRQAAGPARPPPVRGHGRHRNRGDRQQRRRDRWPTGVRYPAGYRPRGAPSSPPSFRPTPTNRSSGR